MTGNRRRVPGTRAGEFMVLAMLGRSTDLHWEYPDAPDLLREVVSSAVIAVPVLRRLVRRQFRKSGISDITAYASTVRDIDERLPDAARARSIEAVIRSMLDESGITAGVSVDEAGGIVVDLLSALAGSLSLTRVELDALIVEAEDQRGGQV